jgi:hypothetical protein
MRKWEIHLLETGPHLKKARRLRTLFFSRKPTPEMLEPHIKEARATIARDVVGVVHFEPVSTSSSEWRKRRAKYG